MIGLSLSIVSKYVHRIHKVIICMCQVKFGLASMDAQPRNDFGGRALVVIAADPMSMKQIRSAVPKVNPNWSTYNKSV